VTEDVRFEYDTLANLECTSPLYPRLWNLEKCSHGGDGVPRFDLVLDNSMLLVKVEVTLTDVVRGTTRRNEHHDFIVSLLTLFIGSSFVNLLGVIRNNALRQSCTMSVRMVSIRETRSITRDRLLPPVRFIVAHCIRIAIVVSYTLLGTPSPIGKLAFGTTQWKIPHL